MPVTFSSGTGVDLMLPCPNSVVAHRAQLNALLTDAEPTYRTRFVVLWERLEELVHYEGGKSNESDY